MTCRQRSCLLSAQLSTGVDYVLIVARRNKLPSDADPVCGTVAKKAHFGL
jgi:hypothetical protein